MKLSRHARSLALLLLAPAFAACGKPEAPAPTPSVPPDAAEAPASPVSPPAPAATETPDATPRPVVEVLSDQWYEQRNDGRKTGWYHMVWWRSTFEGKPTVHDRTEHVTASTRLMDGMEDVFQSRTLTDLERTDDGRLLFLRSESWIEDRRETNETRWTGTGYVRTSRVAGLEEKVEIACAEPVPVDAEAFLAPIAEKGGLAAGQQHEFPGLDFEAKRVRTVRLAVIGEETVTAAGTKVPCTRVRQTVDGRPGSTVWWIDARGVLCKLVEGPLHVVRTTRKQATELDASDAGYEITFEAEPPIARSTSFDRSVVDVRIDERDGVDLPEFPATPFSRVLSKDGATFRMELLAHDAPDATVELPVKDPALAKWLESSNLYAPQDPRIQAEMRRAVGGSSNGRTAAKSILRHVFTSLRKGSGPVPQPTAVEIVESGMGDCSEHCVLFVSLCRAAGLPARRLSGYAQVGDVWGAHSFAEVWLGRWVGADPTTNELGTRARYVAFGWEEDPDSYPDVVSSSVSGHMRIRTIEFEDGGKRVTVADASRKHDLRDELNGIYAAKPPEGWTVDATPGDGLTVSGPGVSARVDCHWGMGDMDVDLLGGTARPNAICGAEFAARNALLSESGGKRGKRIQWTVPWRRRIVTIHAWIENGTPPDAAVETLQKILAPTFE